MDDGVGRIVDLLRSDIAALIDANRRKATVALGASFPVALALAGGEPATAARDASRVYAANTIGAIAGSMAAGFVLVPLLGLRDSIRVASLLAAAAGAALLLLMSLVSWAVIGCYANQAIALNGRNDA